MANRLAMDKSLAINNLRTAGCSQRRIAETLEISRGAVRRHLAAANPKSTEDLIRVLENAFWHFGGAPQTVVFDNAKCAVTKADWYDPELNPKIIEFCKHYRCAFIPTRPRTPRHKGKVERGVDYVQENALRGREFDSLAESLAELPDHQTAARSDRRSQPNDHGVHGLTSDQSTGQ